MYGLHHDAHGGWSVGGEVACQVGQGLPVQLRANPEQEDPHGALAAEAQAPDQVVGAAHVVGHQLRLARADDGLGVLPQIALEAAA